MKFNDLPLALSFDDVLLAPQYSEIDSRSDVDLSTTISENIKLKIPLLSINMDSVTGVKMAIAVGKAGGLGLLPRFDSPDVQADKMEEVKKAGVLAAGAVGCKKHSMERAEKLVKAGADALTLDVAHGHLKKAIETTAKLKERFGKITIISGVVGTYGATKALLEAGADCVRIGVGPGTICTTRIQTGHGMPQITALLQGSKAARELGKTVLSDGGTENSGDVVKGLAAGASAIITGYQLAGTDETPGELFEMEGKVYKEYNASTSEKEKIKQLKKYHNGKGNTYVAHVEGVESLVPYRGSVSDVLESITAGVRSGLSYSGAKNIEELWEKAQFMRVTSAGIKENDAHAVIVSDNIN